jgi:TRAP-type C4-dicarboxylate transport system permease small subunit
MLLCRQHRRRQDRFDESLSHMSKGRVRYSVRAASRSHRRVIAVFISAFSVGCSMLQALWQGWLAGQPNAQAHVPAKNDGGAR